jgi:hypothetical protein
MHQTYVPSIMFAVFATRYHKISLSLAVSFVYLLQQMRSLPRLFIDTQLELALFLLLHIAAIALVSFQVFVARHQNVMIKAQAGRPVGDNFS